MVQYSEKESYSVTRWNGEATKSAFLEGQFSAEGCSPGTAPQSFCTKQIASEKMLDLLEMELRTQNFRFQRIDGQKSLQDRAMALEIFHKDPTCTVMIASIGSVAEGIDLTAASSVHIMEPQWNPMLEEQSLNRAHRIGQTRDVIVNRYIVSNSIEK
ncbi:hypothetical protein N7460_008047 [Penicillium canescens]|uniref:Helicase C-terminal domain-containing protein n=1 Tax=Penicillium canescens TaxID=5083 RepID=A0AAD6I951_PENCN|nr:hypothetical protein N7460_008047 [Penicillium canescens]